MRARQATSPARRAIGVRSGAWATFRRWASPETILLAGLSARIARAGTENRPRCRTFPDLAEGEGFEPSTRLNDV